MKTITLRITLVILTVFISFTGSSQSANDSIQIKQAALDYVEGWFYNDLERVNNACHDEFIKRSLFSIDSIDFLATRSKSYMDYITLYHREREYELEAKAYILDAMSDIASVKVVFNECIEYLHIAKINNQWKVVNILFTGNPEYTRPD